MIPPLLIPRRLLHALLAIPLGRCIVLALETAIAVCVAFFLSTARSTVRLSAALLDAQPPPPPLLSASDVVAHLPLVARFFIFYFPLGQSIGKLTTALLALGLQVPRTVASASVALLLAHCALLPPGSPPPLEAASWAPYARSPLHEAASAGDSPAVLSLLASGSDPNRGVWLGPCGVLYSATPLAAAAAGGHAAVAEALLASGADPSLRRTIGPCGLASSSPPLYIAVRATEVAPEGGEAVAAALLRAGADAAEAHTVAMGASAAGRRLWCVCVDGVSSHLGGVNQACSCGRRRWWRRRRLRRRHARRTSCSR